MTKLSSELNTWIERGFISLLSAVAIWIGAKVDSMSNSVSELNKNVAVLVEQQKMLKEIQDKHDVRILRLEQESKK